VVPLPSEEIDSSLNDNPRAPPPFFPDKIVGFYVNFSGGGGGVFYDHFVPQSQRRPLSLLPMSFSPSIAPVPSQGDRGISLLLCREMNTLSLLPRLAFLPPPPPKVPPGPPYALLAIFFPPPDFFRVDAWVRP